MSWYCWLIVVVPFLTVLGVAVYARRYIRDVVDYLAAGRVCGRYVIAVGDMAGGLGMVALVGLVEANYKAGFGYGFWNGLMVPITLVLSLTGFFAYRFRETRALTFGEFIEKRYSRNLRIMAAFLRTFSEMLTNTIGPAVAARFFIYLFGWPNTLDIFGWEVSTFAFVVFLTLFCALLVVWVGGQISLVVTDALQAIMSYPIFVLVTLFVLVHFSWFDEVVPALSNRVEGESFLNPFDVKGLRDFNLFAVIVLMISNVLNRGVWCGGGSDTAAKTAHEGKMAGILGTWRNGFSWLMVMLLAVAVITLMNHANYVEPANNVRLALSRQIMEEKRFPQDLRDKMNARLEALPVDKEIPPQSVKHNQDTRFFDAAHEVLVQERGETQGNASLLEFRSLFNQMMLPVALREMMPEPLLALMCLLALLLMLSTDDSRIFSSARTLAQDVVLPFFRKPLTVQQQLRLIRILALFTCAVFFCGSLFLAQLDYINLYVTIAASIWMGGAGAVTLGGLYTRFGTTWGAYASLGTSVFISGGGILVQRNWPDHIYPIMYWMGWTQPFDKFLRTVSGPFHPYVVWEIDPVKFPINSNELFFLAMVFSVLAYCVVSRLTCRKPYNLDKLLHRGKYNVEHNNEERTKWGWKTLFSKIIGITPEYTRGDRIIAYSVFGYSFVYSFCSVFLVVLVWNLISPWPAHWWGYNFFVTALAVPCLIGVISTVWFMWGGIRDLRRLFHDLAERKATPEDNGVVKDDDC